MIVHQHRGSLIAHQGKTPRWRLTAPSTFSSEAHLSETGMTDVRVKKVYCLQLTPCVSAMDSLVLPACTLVTADKRFRRFCIAWWSWKSSPTKFGASTRPILNSVCLPQGVLLLTMTCDGIKSGVLVSSSLWCVQSLVRARVSLLCTSDKSAIRCIRLVHKCPCGIGRGQSRLSFLDCEEQQVRRVRHVLLLMPRPVVHVLHDGSPGGNLRMT